MVATRLSGVSEWRYFKEVSNVHLSEIRGGLLGLLGERFVSRLYYEIARSKKAGVWVVLEDNRVVAFLAGCVDIRQTYRSVLLRAGLALAMLAARNMCPLKVLRKLPAMFLYPFQSTRKEATAPQKGQPEPELLAMAVAAKAQRKGLGALLVSTFETALRSSRLPRLDHRQSTAGSYFSR